MTLAVGEVYGSEDEKRYVSYTGDVTFEHLQFIMWLYNKGFTKDAGYVLTWAHGKNLFELIEFLESKGEKPLPKWRAEKIAGKGG